MNGRSERTPKKAQAFLNALSETANVTASARRAGLARTTVYEWRTDDSEFKARWDAAIELGTDALEDEAMRRAKDGVDEPVHYKGERVDTITKYSDTLTIFLLKGRRPEKYRERFEHTGANGGPLLVSWLSPEGS